MDIAVDTNVLIRDPWFRSEETDALLAYCAGTASPILVHEIVDREFRGWYQRQAIDAARKAAGALRDAERTLSVSMPALDSGLLAEQAYSSWESNYAVRIGSVVRIVPNNSALVLDAVRKCIDRVPPAGFDGKGMRDCLIWLGILDFRQTSGSKEPFAFVSGNTNDFAGPDKGSLNTKLEEEIRVRGIPLHYYSSVRDFLRVNATGAKP